MHSSIGHVKRTICLKLSLSEQQIQFLEETQECFAKCCNAIVPYCVENRNWNRVSLHHLCYYEVRSAFPVFGSQMICNAIRKVCSSYKVLKPKKNQEVPTVEFRKNGSVHYDKRTYTLKGDTLSLYTISGRIRCNFSLGERQSAYLKEGILKEAELVKRKKRWFFHLVVELPAVETKPGGALIGVDLGENNLAVTSTGKIFGGKKLRDKRDRFLARRRRLQSNGSRSAKQKLNRISGKEQRCVRQVNHQVSKEIVQEAREKQASVIVMEDLTNIRKRIKGGKRMRSRLHRWSFNQLQEFVSYKAEEAGIRVILVNPAYSSQECSSCHSRGKRLKHRFLCETCGNQQHADINACQNLCRFAVSADTATALVNEPMVAERALATSFSL